MTSAPDIFTPPRRFLYLDRDQDSSAEFRQVLSTLGEVIHCHDISTLLGLLREDKDAIALLDTATLRESPSAHVGEVVEFRGKRTLGLVTEEHIENYIYSIRAWGLHQCTVKTPPISRDELVHFIYMLEDPTTGFGLIRYLSSTVELYSVSINSIPSKLRAIERVTNHFATCGFEVHELYDVRLILEEISNNALFHAFHTASGEEKYAIGHFKGLEPAEIVRIEYGSDAKRVGFAVTDNCGSLPIATILGKLERQLNREGIFDESGRGLYLSRMLATKLVINIEQQKRTQLIALFDETRKSDRAKPFFVNYAGVDTFAEWCADPELDLS